MKMRRCSLRRLFILFFLWLQLCFGPKLSAQQWRNLGTGLNSLVYTLYVDTPANELYVGGWFTNAGGIFASKIARWDGNNWYDLDTGVTVSGFGYVAAIIRFNGDIIVGGQFDTAGNIPVHNIARWDGAQWHSMGNGFNANVNAFAIYNGELYAGGTFDSSGTSSMSNFAKWNGMDWIDVAGGMDNSLTSLLVFDGKLFAGGAFNSAGGVAAYKVASYDGNIWQAVDTGFNNIVYKLREINGSLFALGTFLPTAGNPCRYIAQLVNGNWTQFALPVFGPVPAVADIAFYNNEIYITGLFSTPKNIGRFDGTTYQSLDSGLSSSGNALTVFNGELYVGGNFLNASGVSFTSGIARWGDTTTSIPEINRTNHLASIYPNPIFQTEFHILNRSNKAIIKVELFDMSGRQLSISRAFSDIESYESAILNIRHVIPGLYMVCITFEDSHIQQLKLLKL